MNEMLKKKEDYNILILAMSTLPLREGKLKESCFTWEGEQQEYSYISQLEPITRMLVKEGHCPDEVLMLCTKDTETKQKIVYDTGEAEAEEMSAVEFYRKRIEETEGCQNIVYKSFEVDQYSSDDKKKAISQIAQQVLIRQSESDEKNVKVWIDTQGGFRDVTLLTNAIFSLLKIADISPSGIYSINFQGDSKTNLIIDQTDTYRVFDFVSGMNEFIMYGRADQLEEYYKKSKTKPAVIRTMKRLADSIQLCDMEAFDRILRRLKKEIENGEQTEPLLSVFIEQIRKDYGKLLSDDMTKLDVVEWFHKKKFYQQALTYIESKIPEEWEQKEVLKFTVKNADGRKEKDIMHNDVYWPTVLNSLIGKVLDIKELKCTRIGKDSSGKEVELSVYKRRQQTYDEYLKKIWRRKREVLPLNGATIRYRKKDNEGKIAFTFEVTSQATDRMLLYKELTLYKVLKDERNLFNHMKKETKMQVADLDWFIEYFVQIGRELYKNIEESSEN